MTPSNSTFGGSSSAKAEKAIPIAITIANVIDFIVKNPPSAGHGCKIRCGLGIPVELATTVDNRPAIVY
jgi:hypothetical protein